MATKLLQCPKCPGQFVTLAPGSHVCDFRLGPRSTRRFVLGLKDLENPKTAEELYKAFGKKGKP